MIARKPLFTALLVPLLLMRGFVVAQQTNDAVGRKTSELYKGDLSIFENTNRDAKLQIDRVMDLLRIKRGSHVADIGAGSGWFTVRSARRVGKEGVIYAVEINRDYLRHIRRRAAREKLENVRTILGKPDDPLLPAESVDAVLLLKTYHEIAEPIRLLRHLHNALRPGARLGIIDRNGNGSDHGLNAEVVIDEARRAGYALVQQEDFVKADGMDYFLIFEQVK
ncbi:MAG: class I SAM-dependent methyltransferase [Verrucomicrobiota bacterium]|nr:class I SAM-dependent methyltransferase [Verrucomicrobiota bacterium]